MELYWFPFNRDMWMRTIDRTDEPRTFHGHGFWFKAQNFLQNGWLVLFSKLVIALRARAHAGAAARRHEHAPVPHARPRSAGVPPLPPLDRDDARCGCMEVGFKADPDGANVRRAWEATERLVDEYARRGLYPLNLTLNMRFTGSSGALLTPAYGDGITCYVEIMWMGRPKGWAEFSSDLCREWLKARRAAAGGEGSCARSSTRRPSRGTSRAQAADTQPGDARRVGSRPKRVPATRGPRPPARD